MLLFKQIQVYKIEIFYKVVALERRLNTLQNEFYVDLVWLDPENFQEVREKSYCHQFSKNL